MHTCQNIKTQATATYEHLLATVQPFATVEEAMADCKRRFKNLPDRHFKSVQTLVKQAYAQKAN